MKADFATLAACGIPTYMRLTYQYRLKPTKSQRRQLEQTLESCRWVYNETLATRKNAYEQYGESLNYYATAKLLPQWKLEHPELKQVHSQVLQNVQGRVDLAFQAFFRRVKAGEKPGYPRFKGHGWYDSLTYPQYGNGVSLNDSSMTLGGQILHLSKIGAVKIVLHRPVKGTIKTVTIQRSAGKWYACLSCEQECSGCGEIVPKDLSARIHNCPHCGLKLDRDLNAALNILGRGLASIGADSSATRKSPNRQVRGVVTLIN
jgi:transposase